LSRTKSSPNTSARASPASHSSGRGLRGCYGGNDDVDSSAHVVATNSDRAGRGTPVGRLYYTLDDTRGIVTNGLGRGVRRYLLELVTVHVRNVYDPSTYRYGVIEQIIVAFNSRYPMPEHLVVSSVWLRRTILGHIANRRRGYTRVARAVVDQEAAGLPPRLDGG
jgi:hypothetical protein